MVKVLVVGQTPPPYGGQAIMIEQMLEGEYFDLQLFHVRMAFSIEMDEIGKFRLSKVFHLFFVILRIIYFRFRYNIGVLYYPPAGPNRIPMYRDLAILICTRWLFKKTVFHFHAGGVSELYPKLLLVTRFLFRMAYFNADAAIRLSSLNPEDGRGLRAKKEYIIPNGIKNRYDEYKIDKNPRDTVSHILSVGVLCESKGILVLLKACNLLAQRGIDFYLDMVGRFESDEFEQSIVNAIERFQLTSRVNCPDVLTGRRKYQVFSRASIFCYPTFFEAETFGVVLLEAMMFGLPIVATRWRGVPSVVQDGISGYLVSIKDSEALADKLEFLIKNPDIAKQMGERGREAFLTRYTIDKHCRSLEKVFLSVEASQS
jgi:glycosyltransferase involved in cell wall biosynthesis